MPTQQMGNLLRNNKKATQAAQDGCGIFLFNKECEMIH
jgi:hypothetical protein